MPLVFAAMLPFNAWVVLQKKMVTTCSAYETVFQNMLDPVVGGSAWWVSRRGIDARHARNGRIARAVGGGLPQRSTCVFEALVVGQPQRMLTESGRYLHVQASPIPPSSTRRAAARLFMFRDVSDVDRKTEVRKSELLLRTLVDHSVNGIVRLRWDDGASDGLRTLRCIFPRMPRPAVSRDGRRSPAEPRCGWRAPLAATGMNDEEIAPVLDLRRGGDCRRRASTSSTRASGRGALRSP